MDLKEILSQESYFLLFTLLQIFKVFGKILRVRICLVVEIIIEHLIRIQNFKTFLWKF